LNDCARFLGDAWHMVTGGTIRHCWSHSGLVPDDFKAEMRLLDLCDETKDVVEEINQMIDELRQKRLDSLNELCTADEYVDIDVNEVWI
jgi:hypothetical protein